MINKYSSSLDVEIGNRKVIRGDSIISAKITALEEGKCTDSLRSSVDSAI